MKASQFKELIKEAVREVIKEEFSTPTQPVQEQAAKPAYKSTGNPMLDILNETRASMTSEDFRNIGGDTMQSSMAQNFNRAAFMPQGRAIKPVSDDPQAVAQAIAAAPKQGLDLSQLGFINKAAAIVNTADRKQREKNGI
jgi:aspartate/glutamate racemase